jgi:hypothetical protein
MTGAAVTNGVVPGSLLLPASGTDDPVPVPSGQLVTLLDTIWNQPGPEGLTMRFRFVAPAISRGTGTIDNTTATDDMLYLCETYALPRVLGNTPMPSQIIISLSDRPVEFGVANPEATQFFEAYSIQGETCIWEGF